MPSDSQCAAKPPLGECVMTASHTRRACDNGGSCWCIENPEEVAAINAHPEVVEARSAASPSLPRTRTVGSWKATAIALRDERDALASETQRLAAEVERQAAEITQLQDGINQLIRANFERAAGERV